MAFETGSAVRVIYGYDGSGVSLSAAGTITGQLAEDLFTVELAGDNGDALRLLGCECAVDAKDLLAAGAPAKVASFGWLD